MSVTAMDDTSTINGIPGDRVDRQLSNDIWWYAQRRVWRFPYRDPITHERKFFNCTPARFAAAGIVLPDPSVVRKNTKAVEGLARQLQRIVLRGLLLVRPETLTPTAPMLSVAIEKFHAMG